MLSSQLNWGFPEPIGLCQLTAKDRGSENCGPITPPEGVRDIVETGQFNLDTLSATIIKQENQFILDNILTIKERRTTLH
jgi:hypothetical protein